MRSPRRLFLLAPLVAVFALAAIACTSTPAAPTATPAFTTASPTASTTPTVPLATLAATTGATGASGASGATGVVVPPSPSGTHYAYTCDAGKKFEAVYFPADQQKATLMLEGKTIDLKQGPSGSGTRYADAAGTLTLSSKGATAFIEQGGQQSYANCIGAPVAGTPTGTPTGR